MSFTGKHMDRIPNWSFRLMHGWFALRDRFFPVGSLLDRFGITDGQTVVDYGCGPGSYLKRASELVGPFGRVWAVDIHELALEAVTKRIRKERLFNVTPLHTDGTIIPLADETADLIYALDMFHMVSRPSVMLAELNRICKETGVLFLDDGHQSRREAKSKIEASGCWQIVEENKRYLTLRPVQYGEDDAA